MDLTAHASVEREKKGEVKRKREKGKGMQTRDALNIACGRRKEKKSKPPASS